MSARVFLTQQLLNLSDLRAMQGSHLQQESSRLLINNAHELVALKVVTAYLDALKAKESRDTLLAQTKLADDLYRLTRNQVDQGAAAELDANRATQQVNSLLQQRQEAEQSYVEAKLNLANLLQAQVTSEFDVADAAAYGTGAAPEREATMKAAFGGRMDYLSAQTDVRAAELRVRSVKASRLPTIQARFSDGQSGTTPAHNVNIAMMCWWSRLAKKATSRLGRNPVRRDNFRL